MRKTLQKTLFSVMALTLCGSFVFASCQKFEDFVPEEYGAWDNYYIYRGNVRSKTTGEEGENLITSVTYENEQYSVGQSGDYEIVNDDIYMCLGLYSQTSGAVNALVKYNVKDKTQTVLSLNLTVEAEDELGGTWTYEPMSIEYIFEDTIVLNGKRVHNYKVDGVGSESTQYLYYALDFAGRLTETASFDYSGYTRVGDGYYIRSVNTENGLAYEYIAWNMSEPIRICEINTTTTSYTEVDFVDKNGARGFLISDYIRSDSSARKLDKISFFNIANNETTTVYDDKVLCAYVKWVDTPEKEYFLTYENKMVEYTERDGFLFFGKIEKHSVSTQGNYVLYQLDYSADGVKVETAHIFDPNKDITISGIAGDEVYLHSRWYENASGCKNGGGKYAYYKYNLVKAKEEKIKYEGYTEGEDIAYGYNAKETGVRCGDYAYYLQRKTLHSIGNVKTTVYLLKRYHIADGVTDVMQLWKSGSSHEAEKYCQMMWKSGGDLDDFIVRNY